MIPPEWILAAYQRVEPYIIRTPLTFDDRLQIYIKWENRQRTGSFKLRGALNKILTLPEWERQQGIVAASAGNHGAGVAWACHTVGINALIFVPSSTPQIKLNKIREYGAELVTVQGGYSETEQHAIQFAKERQQNYISPYNDGQIIAGQATIALEVMEDLSEKGLKAWLVPVGGGGLISGIGTALRAISPNALVFPQLIGVQSEASPYMERIYYTGTQNHVIEKPSLADGLAGAVEEHAITIPLVKEYVDSICLVSEEEIQAAIHYAWTSYHEIIEGSAAVTLAAILSGKVAQRPALLVISGGNINPEIHRKIVERGQ